MERTAGSIIVHTIKNIMGKTLKFILKTSLLLILLSPGSINFNLAHLSLENPFLGWGVAAQAEGNEKPRITSMKIEQVTPDNPRDGFKVIVEAADIEGDEITFNYQWSINDEEIVGADKEFIPWQDGFKKGVELIIEVIPQDVFGEGIWRAMGSITIPNTPPKITSTPTGFMEKDQFIYDVKAEDADGDEIKFSLKNAPETMAIDPETGSINWQNTKKESNETLEITIVAEDTDGAATDQVLRLNLFSPEGEGDSTQDSAAQNDAEQGNPISDEIAEDFSEFEEESAENSPEESLEEPYEYDDYLEFE